MNINFAVQSYQSDSLEVSAQRCINAYAEAQPADAKTPVAVFGFPGIDTFTTCGNGPIRAMCKMNGIGYAVSGDSFYKFDSGGTATLIASGMPNGGVVKMVPNGFQIAIALGTTGYIYTEATLTLAEITDTDFHPGDSVAALDGYFAWDWKGTNKFTLSDLLDGLSYDPLMFASAEASPDRVLAVYGSFGALGIGGEDSIEIWQDTGADFPFQRITSATVERGIASPWGIVDEDNSHFLLGSDLVFYRLAGAQTVRLSTHAIEKAWETYVRTDDAFSFAVSYGGHKFIYVTFPTQGVTWGVDLATNLWHERQSWDPSGIEVRWRPNCSMKCFDQTLLGDNNSGIIGKINPEIYTEFGDPVVMTLISPHVHGNGRRVFQPRFELDMKTGHGTTTGQGQVPLVTMDFSDDGGNTWSNPSSQESMGELGNYAKRMWWNELGQSYQRAYRIRISDPVPRVILAARLPGAYFGLE